jgi:hypothetical protein
VQILAQIEDAAPFAVPAWMSWGVPVASAVVLVFLVHTIGKRTGRSRALRSLAAAHGMAYHEHDPAGIGRLRFPAFAGAKGVEVHHVVSLAMGDGRHARAFDYTCWFENEPRVRQAHDLLRPTRPAATMRRHHQPARRYAAARSGAVVSVPAFLPPISIMPSSWVSRAFEAAGVRDIDVESGEFNRGWDVRCGDDRFAALFVDAQLIDLVLGMPEKVGIETFGTYVLLTTRFCPPERLVELARAAARVPEILSPLVIEEYPDAGAMVARQSRPDVSRPPLPGTADR